MITEILERAEGELPPILLIQNGVGVVEKAHAAQLAIEATGRPHQELHLYSCERFTQVSQTDDELAYNDKNWELLWQMPVVHNCSCPWSKHYWNRRDSKFDWRKTEKWCWGCLRLQRTRRWSSLPTWSVQVRLLLECRPKKHSQIQIYSTSS